MRSLFAIIALVLLAGMGYAETPLVIDISKGWRFAPDPEDKGVGEAWFAPGLADNGWALQDAGTAWTAQGFPDVSGWAWYRRRVLVTGDYAGRPVWMVITGIQSRFSVYYDGEFVGAYGDFGRSVNKPALVDLTDRLTPGKTGLIALRVYGGGSVAGLYKAPVFLTTDPAAVPQITEPACFISYADRLATVRVSMRGLGRGAFPGATAHMAIYAPGRTKALKSRDVPFSETDMDVLHTFRLPFRKERIEYVVKTECRDQRGCLIPGASGTVTAIWPGAPERGKVQGKVLNNFVTELVKAKTPRKEAKAFTFTNPQEGWVFFRVVARTGVDVTPVLRLARMLMIL